MWKIVKSELLYLRYGQVFLIIPLTIVGLILIYKSVNIINMTVYMSSLILTANIIGIQFKENRSHRAIVFPIKKDTLATVRILLIVLPVLILFISGIIAQLLYSGYHEEWYDGIYELMMMSGLIIFMENLYLFFSDIFSLFQSPTGKKVFNIIVVTILIILSVLVSISIKHAYLKSFFSGITLIIFLFAGGIIVSAITIYTFRYRDSLID